MAHRLAPLASWLLGAVIAALVSLAVPAGAEVPAARRAVLAHGINLTNWFRYPARQDDAFLRDYLSDAVLAGLHRAGFGFVRLAVQPELMLDRSGRPDPHRLGLLVAAVARIEHQGLGVMVGWHPQTWHLEESPVQQLQLQELWGALAERLRPLDGNLTFPEVLNEPVFPDEPAWEALQQKVLARIRAALPQASVVATGNHWGAIDGLLALHKLADDNVIYSFHTYEPAILTSLASFEPGLDHAALAHLPFPVRSAADCRPAEQATAQERTRDVIRFYCSEHWDEAKLRATVDAAAAWGRRNQVPLVAGEFGASSQLPPATRLAWIAAIRRAFEADGIGWALWGYDDSMGFDLHPQGGPPPPLDPALLRALGLPGHG